jgi:predicted nucleic-acid-binding Zn-ribbon protein
MLSNAIGGIALMVHCDDLDEANEVLKKFDLNQSEKVKLDVIYMGIRYQKTTGFCPKCDENALYSERLTIFSLIKNFFFLRNRKFYCNHCKHLWEK